MSNEDLEHKLREFGERGDNEVPLISSLLMLGALESNGRDTAPYAHHVAELHRALEKECDTNPQEDDEDILMWRLARLNAVLRGKFLYHADEDDYDEPDFINLLAVIDRRKGIPVALGVLYLDLAAHMEWPAFGLNFPGHFLIRLEQGGQRLIIDPFYEGRAVNASDIRALIKTILGERAELHHNYYDAVTTRDVVLRFYNNRKTRFITRGQYAAALETLTHQLWVAPNEPRLYFEAGVLSTKLGHIRMAIENLNEFIQMSDDARTVSEARDMLRGLQRLLH
jgi:regulator of sirC expression with transglutaminase-like and TPR domain